MADASAASLPPFRIEFPTAPKGLALFCNVAAIALYAYCCRELAGNAAISVMFWMLLFVALFLMFIHFDFWRIILRRKPAGVTLEADGITLGSRKVLWCELARIDAGFFFAPQVLVQLRLHREKLKFFSRFFYLHDPTTLVLPGYPVVYREVLPAILALRPDLPVAPALRRFIARPETVRGTCKLPSLLILALCCGGFWYVAGGESGMLGPFVANALFVILQSLQSWCVLQVCDQRDQFVRMALELPLFVGISFIASHAIAVDLPEMETFQFFCFAVWAMAFATLLLNLRLTPARQVIVALLLAGVTLAYYDWTNRTQWQDRCILETPKLSSCSCRWSDDGEWLAVSGKQNDRIFRLATLEGLTLPEHGGAESTIYGFDRNRLIRIITETDAAGASHYSLWAYELASGTEAQIPLTGQPRLFCRRPVSPDGTRLAWLESDAHCRNAQMRLWDLAGKAPLPAGVSLSAAIQWNKCNWLDRDTLVFEGREFPAEPDSCKSGAAHFLRVNLASGATRESVLPAELTSIFPTSDYHYAFAKDKDGKVYLLNLESGEQRRIAASSGLPLAEPSLRTALRVAPRATGTMLARLDLEKGTETDLFPVPGGMIVVGVSADGQYCLLGREMLSFDSGPQYYVLAHLPSGKQKRLAAAGFPVGCSDEWISRQPCASPLSPDGRHIIYETLQLFYGSKNQYYLYRVPENWPANDKLPRWRGLLSF